VSPVSRPVSGMRSDLGSGVAGRRQRGSRLPRHNLSRRVSFTDRFTEEVSEMALSSVFWCDRAEFARLVTPVTIGPPTGERGKCHESR
jgi:hypothetical protein